MSESGDDVDWDAVSFVLSSETRTRILLELRDSERTPSQLADVIGKHRSHVSRGLSELSERGLAVCLTPNRTKGRIYDITEQGDEVIERLHDMTGVGD